MFDKDFNVVMILGEGGLVPAEARFSYPKGVTIDPEGNIIVVDNGKHRVVVYG